MRVAVVEGGQFLLTPQLAIDRAVITGPKKNRKQVLKELAATVAELRQEAKAKGLDTMAAREISAAGAAARRSRHKTSKRSE
ncbi:MAG: hypothetical protein ACLQU1_38130 [Bryobacteraceae bacterium]